MRFIVSSSSLLKQLTPHESAASVRLTVRRGWCELWSDAATTALPIEGAGAHEIETALPVGAALQALRSIEDQPITLDLHTWGNNRIFAACRADTLSGYEPITVTL